MPTLSRVAALGRVCALGAFTVAFTVSAGCSKGKDAPPRQTPGPTVAAEAVPDPQPTARPHLADAVGDLLAAEQRLDHAASFLLLSRQSRAEFKDVADWSRRRQQLPAVTGFRIEPQSGGATGDKAGQVVAVVEHAPGLDPFIGLSPARDTETFAGRQEGDGWLVDGEAESKLILPPDPKAAEAAVAWVTAVQACDQPKANGLQAVATIFGSARGAVGLCGKAGAVTPDAVGPLTPGVASTDIVAQYSTAALGWARVVQMTSPAAFGVVLAPIGDSWKVLGLTE